MSNRNDITTALQKLTVATVSELADHLGWPEKRVRDTVFDLKASGRISAERCDVTKQAAYRLVDAGKAAGAAKKARATPPAGGGDQSPAATHRATRVAGGDHTADSTPEGVAEVIEPPKPEGLPAEACSDETLMKIAAAEQPAPPTDKACCNVARVLATTAGAELSAMENAMIENESIIENLRRELQASEDARILATRQSDAWREVGEWMGVDTPEGLRAEAESLLARIDSAHAPSLYLVRTAKRAPIICGTQENAVRRAISAARAAGRSDVFALHPIGSAAKQKAVMVKYKESVE